MNFDEQTFSSLASFPNQLDHHFKSVPEKYWLWTPASWEGIPSESFPALAHLCHIRDVEIEGYHYRFQKLLNEDEPVLPQLDGYVLEKERQYSLSDPSGVLMQIKAARAETLSIISNLSTAQLNRTGLFEGYGRVSLGALIHNLCSHDLQHLSGLQWLLGKIKSDQATL